jgi:hypothetical protein
MPVPGRRPRDCGRVIFSPLVGWAKELCSMQRLCSFTRPQLIIVFLDLGCTLSDQQERRFAHKPLDLVSVEVRELALAVGK